MKPRVEHVRGEALFDVWQRCVGALEAAGRPVDPFVDGVAGAIDYRDALDLMGLFVRLRERPAPRYNDEKVPARHGVRRAGHARLAY